MKETWNDLGMETVKKLIEQLGAAKGFVMEQAPDVLKQMVYYGIVSNGFYCFLASLVFSICLYYGIKTAKKENPACLGFFLTSAVAVFVFAVNIDNLLKASFAPKLYLIQELSKLIK